MRKKPSTKSIKSFFNKKFQNKNFVKAYEEVSPLMDIAIAIVKRRSKANLSQADLARKLKTSQSVVSRIENGNQNLSVNMLAKIAHVLGCDLSVNLKPHKLAA
jgi:ribosome-binding protein aMBF1 (putative translation factor)